MVDRLAEEKDYGWRLCGRAVVRSVGRMIHLPLSTRSSSARWLIISIYLPLIHIRRGPIFLCFIRVSLSLSLSLRVFIYDSRRRGGEGGDGGVVMCINVPSCRREYDPCMWLVHSPTLPLSYMFLSLYLHAIPSLPPSPLPLPPPSAFLPSLTPRYANAR